MRRGNIEAAIKTRRGERLWIYGLGLIVGILGGLVAVLYRVALSWLEELRQGMLAGQGQELILRLCFWVGISALAGIVVAGMLKWRPLISGSGIPQVEAILKRRIHFDWIRELPLKFLGGSLAMGVGMSLGREGPSIQLGALFGSGVAELTKKKDYERYLITAGAAAGLSAAFNAPLAGVLFCLEELHRNFSPVMLTCSMTAAFAANAVSWFCLGGNTVFGFRLAESLPLNLYPTILLVGVLCGLGGATFNAMLLGMQKVLKRLFPRGLSRLLVSFIAAGLIAAAFPLIAGGGNSLVEKAAGGTFSLELVAFLVLGKLLFTVFSYASGAPGGIFLPMLVIGALLGALVGQGFAFFGLDQGHLANFVILGMVAFFTAVVRAPITGAILITEMSGSFAHFPALILVSVIAALTAGLVKSRPIYDSLFDQLTPSKPEPKSEGAIVLHIPVLEGSVLAGCALGKGCIPERCVVIGLRRGEEEWLARSSLVLQPGDILEVLVSSEEAFTLKDQLLELGKPRSGCIEAET